MKERIIPKRNYFILFFIAILTVFGVTYLADSYLEREEILASENQRMNFLLRVTEDDIKNYIDDNHEAIVYISNGNDASLEAYETKLKKLIIAKELDQDIVYLDTNSVSSEFYTEFSKKYFSADLLSKNVSMNITPNVLIVKDGKVSNILYTYNQDISTLNPTAVIHFIENNYLVVE